MEMAEKIIVSPPGSLNSYDRNKILKDMLFFALVPATFYITAVLGIIQLPNHVISVQDFAPTNNTIIAIVSWVLSQLLNTIRKYIV